MGKIIENYSLQHELGSGVYSKVYKAINLKTKQQVAIKMVKAEKFKELPKLEEGTVNEINILTNLEFCPHIIRYYDMLKTVNNFYFVYQYCNGGTLQTLLKREGPLQQKIALSYFAQILQAFKVLNKNNIMHRDLKPDNILIHDGILKLADFGFCKPLENQQDTTKTMLGSPIYMAPQILKGQTYTIKADIWSLGVVLFRMLFGYCPFESNNIGQLIMKIDKEDLSIPNSPYVSSRLINLLRKMLTKNPNLRADWAEIFSYQIRNGQIVSSGIMKTNRNLTDSGNKSSLSPTLESSTGSKVQYSSSYSHSSEDIWKGKVEEKFGNQNQNTGSGSGIEKSIRNEPKQQYIFNPKDLPLRNTYNTKTPLRQNIRRDLMLKNHSKCIDLTSIIYALCTYECGDSLVLGYLFALNIQKQLGSIMQSIKKDADVRNIEDLFSKNFYQVLDAQLIEIRNNLALFEEEMKYIHNIDPASIGKRRRQHLKKFINSLRFQNLGELVMASRVVDLLEDSLIIRKQTYEKMSRQQLMKKIRDKMQTIHDF